MIGIRRWSGVAIATLSAVLAIGVVLGQTADGLLTVVVKDQSGAFVPGAIVEIVDTSSRAKQASKSDPSGTARNRISMPETYKVRVSYAGFANFTKTIKLEPGKSVTLEAELQLPPAECRFGIGVSAIVLQEAEVKR